MQGIQKRLSSVAKIVMFGIKEYWPNGCKKLFKIILRNKRMSWANFKLKSNEPIFPASFWDRSP